MSTLPVSDEGENVETHQNTAALGQLDAAKGPDEEDDEILEEKSEKGDDPEDLDGDDHNELDDDDDEIENDKKEVEDDDEDQIEDELALGGVIDTEAFALITGIFVEATGERQVLSIPITHLPATLGRSHDTKDPKFFGLGTRKILSRQQALIYYRDAQGGRLVEDDSGSFSYQQPSKNDQKDVIRPKGEANADLPKSGFFVVECLGKNRIFVDGERVEQGEVAMLTSGSSIKVNSYSLLFLLPEDATSMLMKISIPGSTKKRKRPSPSAASSNKTGAALVESLEQTPIATLLEWFFEAIKNNQWERRHQMIGGAITFHACKDAARSKKIKRIADSNKGVSRSEVMDWIKNSKRYGEWVTNVLKKMELKSYQANVTKCLWKSGYRRNAPVGRFVRWNLPSLEELGPPEPYAEGEEEDEESEDDKVKKERDDGDDEKGIADEGVEEEDDEEDSGHQDEKDDISQDKEGTGLTSTGEEEAIDSQEQSENSNGDDENAAGASNEVEESDSDEDDESGEDLSENEPETQDVPAGKRLKTSSHSDDNDEQDHDDPSIPERDVS